MIRFHDSIIVQKVTGFMAPFIQIFALYVLFHGHLSPGGGFQAGVLFGASIILKILAGTREESAQYDVWRETMVAIGGVLVFAVTGGIAMIFGAHFLDYAAISPLAEHEEIRRYLGIYIIEVGVTMTVTMTLVIIFNVLALSNKEIKGLQS